MLARFESNLVEVHVCELTSVTKRTRVNLRSRWSARGRQFKSARPDHNLNLRCFPPSFDDGSDSRSPGLRQRQHSTRVPFSSLLKGRWFRRTISRNRDSAGDANLNLSMLAWDSGFPALRLSWRNTLRGQLGRWCPYSSFPVRLVFRRWSKTKKRQGQHFA
jgi:hypothetical protein